MPVSTLDPTCALVVIDLQRGIVSLPSAHPMPEVVANAASLAKAFRARGSAVVLVNVDGRAPGRSDVPAPDMSALPAGWAELVPELEAAPGDLRVTKQRWGAFVTTDLHARLQALGITQIVLCGVATSIGVESTARSASELGYDIVLVTDAMTDREATAHDNSVHTIFPRLGETTTTAELLAAL